MKLEGVTDFLIKDESLRLFTLLRLSARARVSGSSVDDHCGAGGYILAEVFDVIRSEMLVSFESTQLAECYSIDCA